MAVVGTFLFLLFSLAIIAELVRPGSNTGPVVNSLTNLLTNSIKAAKS